MNFDEEYRKTIKKQSDAVLEYVSKIIVEEGLEEFESIERQIKEEREAGAISQIPKEFDEKMQNIILSFEKKEKKQERIRKWKMISRIAAMIVLCIIVSFSILVVSVDAFRVRFFDFILNDHGEYMDVNIVERESLSQEIKKQLPQDWDSVFYPSTLPKGYELITANGNEERKNLTFSNNKKESIIMSINLTGEGVRMVDSENAQIEEITVNQQEGISITKDGWQTLLWSQSGYDFSIICKLSLQECLKMAESITYIRLK